MKLRVEPLGDELAVVLPDELVDRLNLRQGGSLLLAELADGGLVLRPVDHALDDAMSVTDEVTEEYEETLRALKEEDPG